MLRQQILLTFVLLVAIALSQGHAQVVQKIGFIDSEVILEQMPEYATIEERLSLLSESWQNEIAAMDVNIDQMERQFDAREPLFTEELRQQRLEEIETLVTEREQFVDEKYGPDGEYFLRQRELLEPIQRRIYDALQAIAERDSFDFVFDRANDVRFLVANPEWNLNEAVLLELGIESGGSNE